MARVCCFCKLTIAGSNKDWTSLFSSGAMKQDWVSRIKDLLELNITSDDGLPHYMCGKCRRRFEHLERAQADLREFQRQAKESCRVLARRVLKRAKDSSSSVVSPDTERSRPPPKRLSRTRIDFDSPLATPSKHA